MTDQQTTKGRGKVMETVPDLIGQHPAVAAVDVRIADWAARKAAVDQRLAELDGAAEEYKEAAKDAVLSGGKMPTPPVQSPLDATVRTELANSYAEEKQLLDQARQKALASAFPDIVSEATKLSAQLVTEAAPLAASLRTLYDEVSRLMDAVRASRWAANEVAAVDPQQGRRAFLDRSLDFAEFLRLVEGRGDPISTLDLGGPPRPLPRRHLGMVDYPTEAPVA